MVCDLSLYCSPNFTKILTPLSPLTMTVQSKGEPETVLLLTRTRTDARGRRHSVAVPLLPPPDGEKFAGGYQIQVWDSQNILEDVIRHFYFLQRNPITGGARLLPPTGWFINI